jgi:thioredoxin 1
LIENDLLERLKSNPHPVVIDFWAPWCAPCRLIEPAVEKLADEYGGRVDLWKVNADEQPDVLRSLHIYGIPTLIAFHEGKEVGRRTGAGSSTALSFLFDSAMSGEKTEQTGPELSDRFLRLGTGLALVSLAIIGGLSGSSILMAGLGAVIMFTAVYDRCPIYQMLISRLKELFRRNLPE